MHEKKNMILIPSELVLFAGIAVCAFLLYVSYVGQDAKIAILACAVLFEAALYVYIIWGGAAGDAARAWIRIAVLGNILIIGLFGWVVWKHE